jgi:hypothetical protein
MKFLLVIFILVGLHFFDLLFLSEFQIQLLEIGTLIALFLCFDFRVNYLILLLGLTLVLSALGAKYLNGQDFSRSFIIFRPFYFILFYFLLKKFNISVDVLVGTIVIVGLIFSIVYIVQYLLYPEFIITNAKMTEDRAKVRIYLQGELFLVVTNILSLLNFKRSKKAIWLVLVIWGTIIVIIQSTRILILAMFIIYFFSSFKLKLKSIIASILAFSVLLVIGFFIINYLEPSLFGAYFETFQRDVSIGEDYIRFQEFIYFLAQMYDKPFSFVTGNGIPSSFSAYGQIIDLLKDDLNYHLSDIGLFGDYYQLGLPYLFYLILLVKFFLVNTRDNLIILKTIRFSTYFMLICIPTISFYSRYEGIILVSIFMYIINKKYNENQGRLLRSY